MTPLASKPPHDLALFDALCLCAATLAPDMRTGQVFGSPAVFRGRRMAACVLGAEVGLRLPEALAKDALMARRARAFTPYGKRQMREWIALDLPPDQLHRAEDLIAAALTFAGENDARRS